MKDKNNKQGIYETLWTDTLPNIDTKTQEKLMDNLTTAQKRCFVKLRNGCLWNTKRAHMLGLRPKGAYKRSAGGSVHPCPLCGGEDGGTHIACNCTHPDIKGLIIKRHDDVVRILAKAIEKSNRDYAHNCLMMVDAKGEEGVAKGWLWKRVPKWVLPDIDDNIRKKMRPDILLLRGLEVEPASREEEEEARNTCSIAIVEVGVTMDQGYASKKATKDTQHLALREALSAQGWKIDFVENFIVGVSGTHFTASRTMLESRLKLDKNSVDLVLSRITKTVSNRTMQIVRCRRFLEHGGCSREVKDFLNSKKTHCKKVGFDNG
jgi:hypothetical protein